MAPPDGDSGNSEYVFKCHSNFKVPNIVICVICENVYHQLDLNRYKKTYSVGKFLVVCPDHCNDDDITLPELAMFDKNAKKVIAYVKMHEKEELRETMAHSVSLDLSQRTLDDRVVQVEDDKLINALVEVELLRELNLELKSKNKLLTDLLDRSKSETKQEISYADIMKNRSNKQFVKNIPSIVIKAKDNKNDKTLESVKKKLTTNSRVQIMNVTSTKSGSVIVRCHNKENVCRTQAILTDNLGDNYQVEQEIKKLPKIKVTDIDKEMSREDLEEDIGNRNSIMYDGVF